MINSASQTFLNLKIAHKSCPRGGYLTRRKQKMDDVEAERPYITSNELRRKRQFPSNID